MSRPGSTATRSVLDILVWFTAILCQLGLKDGEIRALLDKITAQREAYRDLLQVGFYTFCHTSVFAPGQDGSGHGDSGVQEAGGVRGGQAWHYSKSVTKLQKYKYSTIKNKPNNSRHFLRPLWLWLGALQPKLPGEHSGVVWIICTSTNLLIYSRQKREVFGEFLDKRKFEKLRRLLLLNFYIKLLIFTAMHLVTF